MKKHLRLSTIQIQILSLFTAFSFIIAAISSSAIYLVIVRNYTETFHERVGNVVLAAAPGVDGDVLDAIYASPETTLTEYELVRKQLFSAYENIAGAEDLYTMRMNENGDIVFIVEGSYDDDIAAAGEVYTDATETLKSAFSSTAPVTIEEEVYTDQWGTFLSAYAPIYRSDGSVAAMLGVDMSAESLQHERRQAFWVVLLIFAVSIPVGMVAGYLVGASVSKPILNLRDDLAVLSRGQIPDDVEEDLTIIKSGELGEIGQYFTQMRRYIANIAQAAHAIAKGDLSLDIKPTSDQDQLATAFAMMTDSLRGQIRSVSENAGGLKKNAFELSTASREARTATEAISHTMEQVSESSVNQSSELVSAAQAMDQMEVTIESIASGAVDQSRSIAEMTQLFGELNTAIETVSGSVLQMVESSSRAIISAAEGSETVEKTIIGMDSIMEKVSMTTHQVMEMKARSEQINDILETIQNIASQTNMLALNAAIEAARAGEAGKGFAVVAAEVRHLADESMTASKGISGLIVDIQSAISRTVSAMNDGENEVRKGQILAKDAGASLTHLKQSNEDVRQQTRLVRTAVQHMQKLSQDLANQSISVSAVVEENTASTEQMSANSKDITGTIKGIARMGEENSALTQEATASTMDLSTQVEQVRISAGALQQMAEDLSNIVDHFKLE